MKAAITALLFMLIATQSLQGAVSKPKPKYKTPRYSKQVISERIKNMQIPIEMPLNKTIKNYIDSYLIRGRKSTAKILGKSVLYFPIFESYLKKHHLPESLKFLTVIESALDPRAISPVGAVGLWQLMPVTAHKHGLVVNSYVDERMDPHKSCEAAVKQLSYLYDRFEDWTLAIAAYNCGSGRMAKSIKAANSRNYHKVKKYLPKETTNYIQKFIAASYVMNYHLFYDLHANYPDYNLQVTETVLVKERENLKSIASAYGLDLQLLTRLNPSYLRGIVPANQNGSFIILPSLGLEPDAEAIILTLKN